MKTLRLVTLSLSYIAGISWAAARPEGGFSYWFLVSMALGALLSVYLFVEERRWKEWPSALVVAGVVLIGLPLGLWRGRSELNRTAPGSLGAVLAAFPENTRVAIRGTVCAEPESRSDTHGDWQVAVEAVQAPDGAWRAIENGRVRVSIRAQPDAIDDIGKLEALMDPEVYGYRVQFAAPLRRLRAPLNPGEFDVRLFLLQENLDHTFVARVADTEVLETTRGPWATELALAAKRSFLATYKETIRSPESRLVAAATLGTRRAVERATWGGIEIVEAFRHSGVGHVLAVSGLHVSVIAVLLFSLFSLVGLRSRQFAPVLIACLALFVLLTGARPSSVRAAIMTSVIVVSFSYFRVHFRKATFGGLALSSLLILLPAPIVLFSPSFLLSYGAVLSLVLVAPPVDRCLCLLRGFSLVLFVIVVGALFLVSSYRFDLLLDPAFLASAVALLVLAGAVGGRLNNMFPAAWRCGYGSIPTGLRLFFSAQFAIQFGMMIPLSAWFFGQFPVAGALINLLAIPLIGVLVQLGMLVGIVGLVPSIGLWLALPFGVAVTLVARVFYAIAHAGAVIFPFPAMPKPSLGWMVAYYVALGALLFVESRRHILQSGVYRLARAPAAWRGARIALGVALAAMLAAPLWPRPERVAPERTRMLLCAARSFPSLVYTAGGREATVINPGSRFTAERLLFPAMRGHGAVRLRDVFLAGAQPFAGNEGLARLAELVPIERAFLPFPISDPTRYFDAVGDAFAARKAREGEPWAQYEKHYAAALDELARNDTAIAPLPVGGFVESLPGLRVAALPISETPPSRFATSARTAPLVLETHGYRWLAITDATPASLRESLDAELRVHVLVLPDLTMLPGFPYRALADAAFELTRPAVVLFAGDRPLRNFEPESWAQELGVAAMTTHSDGAIAAEFEPDGAMTLTGYRSGRRIRLEPVDR